VEEGRVRRQPKRGRRHQTVRSSCSLLLRDSIFRDIRREQALGPRAAVDKNPAAGTTGVAKPRAVIQLPDSVYRGAVGVALGVSSY
jgi:hypothetical protein